MKKRVHIFFFDKKNIEYCIRFRGGQKRGRPSLVGRVYLPSKGAVGYNTLPNAKKRRRIDMSVKILETGFDEEL